MSDPTPTTTPPSTYSSVPDISNGTHYISAQSFGLVVEFASPSGNLTKANFTGDTFQQVFPLHFYCLGLRKVDTTEVAGNGKP